MGITFNIDEILAMAEEIERNGEKFYRKAAGGRVGEAVRKLLLELADMEVDHQKTFAAMRAGLASGEKTPTVFDPDNQSVLYLQSIADGNVFDVRGDPSSRLTGKETPRDVLKTAIGLEKDSIVFYTGIRNVVGKSLGRDKVVHIIEEEMSHVTMLSRELAALGKA